MVKGLPVVYHGSYANIEGNNFNTEIVYFSGNEKFAREFGSNVKEYRVLLKNPYRFDEQEDGYYHDEDGAMVLDEDGAGIPIGYLGIYPGIVKELLDRGYDGAMDGSEFIVVFDNNQIVPLC